MPTVPQNSPPINQSSDPDAISRRRLNVRGIVQGVGFRPFVHNLALRHGLTGLVGNDSSGAFIEVEGPARSIRQFCADLQEHPPPLAHIDGIEGHELPPLGGTAFVIVESIIDPTRRTMVSPDLCLCDDCRHELFDATDRRYLYPFINCTNCGPRFTIIRSTPYDRPATTMAAFPMCPDCAREYADPTNRRFHAQPNACPVCGPQVEFRLSSTQASLWPADESMIEPQAPLRQAQRILAAGGILAVKGLGGFHLACDAGNEDAVQRLRARKGRGDKPFAVMAATPGYVREFATVAPDELALLTSRERPIVLLAKREPGSAASIRLARGVAPGNALVGVMLPYTPLHELLFHRFDWSAGGEPLPVLVMTSGNLTDEPIVWENAVALERLAPLADAFLLHNREIQIPCDDSVMRSFEQAALPVRRSRGYAPFPVKLPFAAPALLATGGELKATFCLAEGEDAVLSQHIGDMENLETLDAFTRAAEHLAGLFRIQPEILACDMHPGYLSSRWAHATAQDRPVVPVQHHHAHIAALMAEQKWPLTEPLIGFSFDGTGYGSDGAIWGGEVLIATYHDFQRAGHLRYFPLPGGDTAVRKPYRTALACLWAAGLDWEAALGPLSACSVAEQQVLKRQLETGLNCVACSSMGRLFDAVAALAGVRQIVQYEAQAAIELESLVTQPAAGARHYVIQLDDNAAPAGGAPLVFDPAPLLRAVLEDGWAGTPPGLIGARFHLAVADLMVETSVRLRERHGLATVALSGGVFQNLTLLTLATGRLRAAGFRVLVHRQVPPNDGGLALGQAAVAAARVLASQ